MIESEIGVMPLLEQGHMLRNKANIENLEKAMNLNLPWSFQKKKKIQPCQHIDFVLLSFFFWLCDIYQYKAINLDCFDPPSIKASIKT